MFSGIPGISSPGAFSPGAIGSGAFSPTPSGRIFTPPHENRTFIASMLAVVCFLVALVPWAACDSLPVYLNQDAYTLASGALGVKTPAEIKDFSVNWATDLGTDTVSTSSWSISPSGPSITFSSFASQSATVWISGGIPGFYDVTNTITTAGGRTLSETFKLEVVAANYI